VLLSVAGGQRTAAVWKSSFLPPAQALYTITEQGVQAGIRRDTAGGMP
jgi:hypothetical protein